ncbi:MAG: zinc ribbon domain-containing protein [Candidatus Margulisbacteria bacterium]|jgi:putative FmdB family regulatory protein|nr:zinc ribbon domain-containing protein [Candidatus Margulisiibacteriota bacterium]
MPFYDYKCDRCGQVTEVSHGMNDSASGRQCQECGRGVLARIFHVFGRTGGSSSASSGGSCSSCASGSCGSCHH